MQMNWAVVRSNFFKLRYQNYDVDDEPKIIELHGDRIYDKFHWLEEDSDRRDIHLSFEDYTLQQYLKLNAHKNDWLKVKKIFREATDYKLFSDVQYGNWYMFYSYMDFSRGMYKPIFYRARSLKGLDCPHVVLDSNQISGTVIEHEYSPNGEYCAFTISNEIGPSFIHVVDVETGENYGRSLKFKRFFKKIAWSKDSKGFFVYYDPRGGDNLNIFYHYLDRRKRDLFIVAIRKAEIHTSSFQLSADYKYLILRESLGVSIANIESMDAKIQFKLIFRILPDVTYDYVGNVGDKFLFLTNLDAPKHRVIEININAGNPELDSFQDIVAVNTPTNTKHQIFRLEKGKCLPKCSEIFVAMCNAQVKFQENYDSHGVLQSAYKYGAYLFLIYIENFQSSFYLYSLELKCIEFQIDLKDEQFLSTKIDEFGFYFETMSYESLQKIYKIDFVQLVSRPKYENMYTMLQPMLKRASKVPNLSDDFSISHDSFYSFDGSNVPLTVIQKKNGDTNKPCLVFSYGGFNVPMLPQFKLIYLLFIELFNGIVVIIYIRGGGELGDDWLLKPSELETSFNDLIVGVEYLKSKTYRNLIDSNKIAFLGISHGGLAGSVTINKRRDLFRAVILQNANVDLIRDLPHKGRIWKKQYGDLKKKEDYDHIKRYAPLLHIEEPNTPVDGYPTTLVVASRFDEVVDFANSLKYVAMRRAISADSEFQEDKPILLKVINSGGHQYESAEKHDFLETIFAKLQFLAQSMDLRLDKMYQ